jgi:hypothetical protein
MIFARRLHDCRHLRNCRPAPQYFLEAEIGRSYGVLFTISSIRTRQLTSG